MGISPSKRSCNRIRQPHCSRRIICLALGRKTAMFILLPLLSADFANSDKTRAGFLLGRGKAGVTGTIRRRVSPPLKQVETNAFRPLPPHWLLCATAVEGKHRPSSGSLGSAQAAQPARASRADKTLHAARTRCSVNHLQRGGFLILKKKIFFFTSLCNTYKTNKQTKGFGSLQVQVLHGLGSPCKHTPLRSYKTLPKW